MRMRWKREMIYIEKKAKGGYFNRLFDRENIHYTYVDSADDFEDTKGNIYITSQKTGLYTTALAQGNTDAVGIWWQMQWKAALLIAPTVSSRCILITIT